MYKYNVPAARFQKSWETLVVSLETFNTLGKKSKTCRNSREGDTQLTVQTGQIHHEKNTN